MSEPASEHDVVTVERVIPAAPEAIFDLLADPSRHREIDGSGTVRDAKAGSERLGLGSSFGMSMKMGLPYSMVSTVIEFDENRLIAWQTTGPTAIGKHVGGRSGATSRAGRRRHQGQRELGHPPRVRRSQAGGAHVRRQDPQEPGGHPSSGSRQIITA
jgi:uncharacterized protein YndB with AHSA1/START domain